MCGPGKLVSHFVVQRADFIVAIACVPCGPRRSLIPFDHESGALTTELSPVEDPALAEKLCRGSKEDLAAQTTNVISTIKVDVP